MINRDGRCKTWNMGGGNPTADLDWNRMDDRLQRIMGGLESMSPTSIRGPDGRNTVAIVVDYAWYQRT